MTYQRLIGGQTGIRPDRDEIMDNLAEMIGNLPLELLKAERYLTTNFHLQVPVEECRAYGPRHR